MLFTGGHVALHIVHRNKQSISANQLKSMISNIYCNDMVLIKQVPVNTADGHLH